MNTSRSILMKSMALGVAALFTVGVVSSPADAAPKKASAHKVVPLDSGWGPIKK